MSLYNMLFGMNSQSDLLLAVLGLKKHDVERFRDCSAESDGSQITIYTRTGGGNREAYPNLAMRKLATWSGSVDDDFDCTYCTDTFAVPEQWRADVAGLRDILKHGLRAEFCQHLAATLNREPTEADKESAAYDAEAAALKRLDHYMANGHTFVPLSDYAMEAALKLAEANGGSLRSCWGIAPIKIIVERDKVVAPGAKDERERKKMRRIESRYDYRWEMDEPYWAHCCELFGADFPLTMAKIAETVEAHQGKKP